MAKKKIIRGAGGVVFNPDGAVLLLQHVSGDWLFPKGHVDPGETLMQAALREVEEEAGVVAQCLIPEMLYTTEYVNRYGQQRQIIWFLMTTSQRHTFVCEPSFLGAAFVVAETALATLSFPQDRSLLEHMLLQHSQIVKQSPPVLGGND